MTGSRWIDVRRGEGLRAWRRAGLLVVSVVALSISLILATAAARQHFFELDRDTVAFVKLVQHDPWQSPMRAVSVLGDNSGLIPLILVATLVLWRPRRRWALILPLVMAGTGVLQFVAKWAVARPRPNLAPWGFPSGHVLSLVVFFGLVAYLLWTSGARRRWRCLGSGVCLTALLFVAASRLYLGVHWLSDVVGGFTVGLAYLLFAIWIAEILEPRLTTVAEAVDDRAWALAEAHPAPAVDPPSPAAP